LAPFSVRFDAHAFERHRCANVRFFVIGQGRREDSADGLVVVGSNGGAREDVHRGRQCAAAAADDVSDNDTADADADGDGNGSSAKAAAVAAARQRDSNVGGSLARQLRWRQRDSATLAVAAARQRNVGGSLVAARRRWQQQRRWRQRKA
jgi:hypothetical protein